MSDFFTRLSDILSKLVIGNAIIFLDASAPTIASFFEGDHGAQTVTLAAMSEYRLTTFARPRSDILAVELTKLRGVYAAQRLIQYLQTTHHDSEGPSLHMDQTLSVRPLINP